MTDFEEHLADERRTAARLLIRYALVHDTHVDFPLIRRHADHLQGQFNQMLGYRLTVEPGFARLHKAGLGRDSMRRLERASGAPFTPRTYAYLALTLSVLVTSPEQLLLSELVTGVQGAAAEAGLELGAGSVERRALVAALKQLQTWRVLTEDEGSVESYGGDDRAEALLSVDREIARRLVGGQVNRAGSPAELIEAAAAAGSERHAVRRRLVETPVVLLADLEEEQRDWLRRNQRREERVLEDFLGFDAEIRAEGMALIDPLDELTDLEFPGTGTLRQAALLLLERLAAGEHDVDAILADLTARHHRHWSREPSEHPEAFRDAVLTLLTRLGLLTADGRPTPVASRYLPQEQLP